VQVVRIERGRVGNRCFITKMETAPWSGRADPQPSPPPTWRDGTIVLVDQKLYASSGSTSVDFSGRACEDPIRCGRGVPSLYCAYTSMTHKCILENSRLRFGIRGLAAMQRSRHFRFEARTEVIPDTQHNRRVILRRRRSIRVGGLHNRFLLRQPQLRYQQGLPSFPPNMRYLSHSHVSS